jgi:hypothetical protein
MFLVQFEGQFTQHVFLVCCLGGCFEKQTVCKIFFGDTPWLSPGENKENKSVLLKPYSAGRL